MKNTTSKAAPYLANKKLNTYPLIILKLRHIYQQYVIL